MVDQRVAAAFPWLGADLQVIGRGSNPARRGATIAAAGSYAYRVDDLADAAAEIQLQAKAIPPPLGAIVADTLEPRVLLEWKQNLALFFREHPNPWVVGVKDVRAVADGVVIKMEKAECTVDEELRAAQASLRSAVLDWLMALAHIETTLGLTFVDVHLGNFALFQTSGGERPVRKLIDLESLQPLRMAFEEDSESTGWMGRPSPTVPSAYTSFLHGFGDESHRHALQSFFVALFVRKLERYMVDGLRKTCLEHARDHAGYSCDELTKVERFISEVAEPLIADLKAGAVRPDRFYQTLLRRVGGPNGLLAPTLAANRYAERRAERGIYPIHPGDAAKWIVVALCLSFLGCIVLHEAGAMSSFSRSYLQDGFCVANKDTPLVSSHGISCYADMATALGMLALVRVGRAKGLSEAAVAPIAKNCLSLLGHGVGHLCLAIRTSGGGMAAFEGLSPAARVAMFAAFTPVWYAFMMDRRRSVASTVGFTLFHNTIQTFLLPTRFFFTHVLLAVLLGSAQRWLRRPRAEKTHYYAMEAWLVDVPILLAAFGEALTCDSFLIRVGGHVWFDMIVPIGFAVYFLILVNDPRELRPRAAASAAPLTDHATHPQQLVHQQPSLRHGHVNGHGTTPYDKHAMLCAAVAVKRQVSGG